MTVTIGCECGNPPDTGLTSIIDQAALQGLLRRFYSVGLRLLKAIYIRPCQADAPDVK
jgi:hypothetical protein